MSPIVRFFDVLFSPAARRKRYLHRDPLLLTYVQEVQSMPRLSPEEEAALLARAIHADLLARQRLVEANLRLVFTVAVYFQGRGLPLPELIQEGNLGLMEAIIRFDQTRARRLSTYAKFWIHKKISQMVIERSKLIHLPSRTAQQLALIKQTLADCWEQGIDPGTRELAQRTHLSVARVVELLTLLHDPVSLQRPHVDIGSLADTIEAPPLLLAHEPAEWSWAKEKVMEVIGHLTSTEQHVIKLRLGLEDGVVYDDYHEIARKVFNRSGKRADERIRQLEKSAIRKLRVALEHRE